MIPPSWTSAPLGEVALLGSGGTPSRTNSTYFDGGTIPWVVIGDLNDSVVERSATHITELGLESSSAKLVPAGTLLIAMYGSIGKLGIAGMQCATNQAIAYCKPGPSLDPKFLFYFLMHAKPSLVELGQGGTQQNISQGVLKKFPIKIAPLPEQGRIVKKLDVLLARVDACRARFDRVPDLLKRFRRAVLEAATSGALTEDWREANPLPGDAETELQVEFERRRGNHVGKRAFKESSSPDLTQWAKTLPPSWAVCSVSRFSPCLDHLRVPVTRDKRSRTQGRYPYYGANGLVDMVDEFIFDEELVLVTEDETFYGREKPIAYRASGRCWVNNHAHVLAPGTRLRADFLCYSLMHYDVLPWLTGTTGRAKLTQGVLNALPIAVPPLSEMEEIVRRVQALFALADSLESKCSAAQTHIDRFTPALLAKAFRGELVPQDPKDEPADILLARLRGQASRVGTGVVKRRRSPSVGQESRSSSRAEA